MDIDKILGTKYILVYQKPSDYGDWYELLSGDKDKVLAAYDEAVSKNGPHAYAVIEKKTSLLLLSKASS